MGNEHTVRSYDEDLGHLANLIARMGGIAEAQFAAALQAVVDRDSDLAGKVVAGDSRVDALEQEIYAFAVRLLALRQPVAQDLRQIIAALRVSGDLERMADYAANVAKRAIVLNGKPPVSPVAAIPRLGNEVRQMFKDVLDAYLEGDADKALAVRDRDGDVDAIYTGLFRELVTYMMEDARTITACTHLLFIAKNIERIGDHATNIAETIHFLVHGTTLKAARRKADELAVAAAGEE